MNYISLNGKKSTYVQGLLIQSLPPISKPLKRTQIEEIDGRDGDIVTVLGYSAYDKPCTIGLYGHFDIDEVIAYFDSEGIVTFSNEPYKFYKYQILDQIDFERLVRFRTATVTFHVQPFKWSTVESPRKFVVDSNLLKVPNKVMTSNGVTLTVQNGHMTVKGTPSTATEFYLPIEALTLNPSNYTLSALANGTRVGACSIRLIESVPSDAQSFGGRYVALSNGQTVTITSDVASQKIYHYLWFYITSGGAMDFTLDVEMVNNSGGEQAISIKNNGNTKSKPKMTIQGSGVINLSLNGMQVFAINLGTDEKITIDVAQMEAYQDGVLKNRFVTGNYDNFMLNVGTNTISWTGDVTEIDIDAYSRWI